MSPKISRDKLLALIEPIARQVANQYAGRIPHESYEDVVGDLILAQLTEIRRRPYTPFLKRTATNEAIDLIRKGKHRQHAELDAVLATGEDGEALTYGDWLAEARGHPGLISPSVEEEYLEAEMQSEAGRQELVRQIASFISIRARKIGEQRLRGEAVSDADRTYLSGYRKKFPAHKKKLLFG